MWCGVGRVPPPSSRIPDEWDSTDDTSPAVVKDVLDVTDVRFNFRDDLRTHRTNEYEVTQRRPGKDAFLVVRRGQTFQITLTCDRPYDPVGDDLVLIFSTGSTPQHTKGTLVRVPVSEDNLTKQWGAKVVKRSDNDLQLDVMTPPFCAVGRWNIKVRAVKKGEESGSGTKVYSHPRPIYILFNPWCKDDQVYHHDNGLLDEYVMNETGKIFVGDSEYIRGRHWNFDQFEDPVLDCVLDLLDQKGFPASSRDDPVKVARKLSALVNSSDERGVLTGNWSGNYSGGRSPSAWTGSLAILEQYHKTKSPVRFGQCWVFSGVLTTCCRTLGIPTRSVTNFNSAHNTDISNTIDVIIDEYGMPMDEYNSDSVWNFHVWNDVWMARPDLGNKDYGGWQALDSTPQETSDGLYCCGPCPLLAIKKGDITVPYDGHFIYCEVNADRVYWKIDNATLKMYKMETDSIGKRLSTHRPRCLGPGELTNPVCRDISWQEITDQYKYPEGSGAERAAVYTTAKWGHLMGLYGSLEESKDVIVKMTDAKRVAYGDDLEVEVNFENLSEEDRTISGTWSLQSYYSTGVFAQRVRSERIEVTLNPAQKISKKMRLSFGEYNPKTVEGCYFKTLCVCTVRDTKQVVSIDGNFRLIKYDLHIQAPAEVREGDTFKVKLTFKNPLPISLTLCSLEIEGPGLLKPHTHNLRSIEAKSTWHGEVYATASKLGTRTIVASFDSKELVDINGSCEVEVKAR